MIEVIQRSEPVALPSVVPWRLQRIVVGVDGSENSLAALSAAVQLAARDGATVEAVCAYHTYHSAYFDALLTKHYGSRPPDYVGPGAPSGAAGDALDTLEEAARKIIGPKLPDTLLLRAIQGHPADVLVKASENADLLVVGAHGRSGVLGSLLGSTTQTCIRYAGCPVLVVPPQVKSRFSAESTAVVMR